MQLCCFDKHGGETISSSSQIPLRFFRFSSLAGMYRLYLGYNAKWLHFNRSIKHNVRCSPPSSCVGLSVLRPRCYRAAESIEAPASTWSPCLHVQREFSRLQLVSVGAVYTEKETKTRNATALEPNIKPARRNVLRLLPKLPLRYSIEIKEVGAR